MIDSSELTKDEINWEDAYGDQCKLYKKTKKKLKKNRHKIKQLKKAKKDACGFEKRQVNKKLLKHQKHEKVLRDEVKALKKVLHTTKNELSKQQMENQQLKMQSLYESQIIELKAQMKNRDQITMMLLQEALPGLVDKYWKHGGSSNGRKSKSIVDDVPFKITDLDE